MNLGGKFSRVSKTTYRDGVVLVGFCGNVWPRDLEPYQIDFIRTFFNMPRDSEYEVHNEWPEEIEPAYAAARKNFINGFLLIRGMPKRRREV